MRGTEALENGAAAAGKPPAGWRRVTPPHIGMDHLWLAFPFLLVVWLTAFTRLPALDFWWHLKCGQIIWSTGSIPTSEIFSYTAAGKEFLLQNWLAEVAYYFLYQAGGPALIIGFNTLLLLATLLPVYLLCRHRCESAFVAALATCFAAFPVAMTQGNIRPGVFSFALFAWFYLVLTKFRFGHRKAVWLLPVLMILWVNLHGAFVLGIGLVVLFLGVEAIALPFAPGEARLGKRGTVQLLAVLGLMVAATLVNPQFSRIYDYVLEVTKDPVSRMFVTEWQAPRVSQVNDLVRFFGPFFLVLFVLLRSRRRPELLDIALLFAFAVFALTAKRNGAWFAIVAGPILAAYLPLTFRFRRRTETRFSHWFNFALATAFLVLTVRALPWVQQLKTPTPERRSALLDPDLPVRAADFMAATRLEGRMFHPQNWGDYLVWRLWPVQRTFFDGRVHVFTVELAKDYFAVMRADPDWQRRLDKYQVRQLLLNKKNGEQSGLINAARNSADWQVRYEDGQSILFERHARLLQNRK